MPDLYFGKYTGVVKDNRDSQKLGQLLLSVPAIFPVEELVVARAALPYGFFFVPENEAKVWVEFEGGDTGLPLWTGIQYVPGEWAPEAEADPPTRRVIKTASGHLVIFDDTGDEEKIEVREGVHGHVVVLDADGISVTDGVNGHTVVLDGSGIAVQDAANNHSVVLDSAGITLESGGDVIIRGTNVTIEATADVSASGSNVTLDGSTKLTATGAEIALEATGQLTAAGQPIHLNP